MLIEYGDLGPGGCRKTALQKLTKKKQIPCLWKTAEAPGQCPLLAGRQQMSTSALFHDDEYQYRTGA